MFVAPNDRVYAGRIIGRHCKDDDLVVNVCKAKKLTNIRAAASDKNVILKPPMVLSLEQALEFIAEDELVEITPDAIRLRKRLLTQTERKRMTRRKSPA